MAKTAIITTQAEKPMTLNRGVPEKSAAQVRPAIAVVEVPIAEIRVEGRRRELRAGQVQRLAESIAAIGLQTPLTLYETRAIEDGLARRVYRLVAGAHRLEACRGLGWTSVAAILTEAADLERELWEIDENLCRAELNELEKCEHLLARQGIYDLLHPETRAGGDRGNQYTGSKIRHNAESAFCHDASEKTGVRPRTIQHAIRRAKKILPEVRDIIRRIDAVADSGVELDALAELTPDQQRQVTRDLTSSPGMSVHELVLARAVEKPGQEKDRREPPLPSKQEANAIVRARKTPQRVEAERLEQFDQAWRHVVTTCKLSLKIDVPDLSDDQRNRLGVELRQAARNVGKFRLKIEAPAARTKETPA